MHEDSDAVLSWALGTRQRAAQLAQNRDYAHRPRSNLLSPVRVTFDLHLDL
jgi:hypothetical protein